MIAVDTNILVYAHRADSSHHTAARKALATVAADNRAFGIPWPCVHEFYSIVTHPRIYDPPSTVPEALAAVAALDALPHCTWLGEGADHLDQVTRLVASGSIRGPKIHDARIAAICLSHGVTELWTADRDFSYFPSVRVRNPLVS